MTFKVGDSVRHNIRGRAEVMYGPYTNTFGREHCVIGLPSGCRLEVPTDALSTEPKFAIGDVVRNPLTGIRGPIVAGPFIATGDGERYWIVEQPDGRHSTPREDGLTKAEAREVKTGDRVRVVEDDPYERTGEFVGLTGTVEVGGGGTTPFKVRFGPGRHGTRDGFWYCAKVELIDDTATNTFEHNGVTYDLTEKYRDKDGDTWRFERRPGGDVRGNCYSTPMAVGDDDTPLSDVVRSYGPLTKI